MHENLLRFNLQLYRENSEDFLKQTVPHEVAHLVAHQLFGDRIQPHGEEWQLIMRGVYELPPHRCHNYAVKRRTVTRYIYRCRALAATSRSRRNAIAWCARGGAICAGAVVIPWCIAARPGWNKASQGTPAPTQSVEAPADTKKPIRRWAFCVTPPAS